MSQPDPLLNQVLGGARLLQRVSKGLMAHVYRGHYERLGIPVAVKVLSPKAMAQGMNRERFVREGRALAQLAHPNIIKIYNVGHESNRFFIIMDWIQDGMNLRQLAQTRPLTPAQSLKVVQRLCEALEYIHQKGLIHRDVKPANVCLRRGGHPVLMDFSLIKDEQSDVQLTAPGTIMGTVNFMPPEQAQPGGAFGDVGVRSDVYSLGGTLYWLLTGKPPFQGRTPMETIIKLMREQPQPPSAHNPSLPAVVDQLVLNALSKKSADRPATAKDLAGRIESIFQSNRAELDAAQRPALAEGGQQPGQQPAPSGSGRQPSSKTASASWGSSSSQSAGSGQRPGSGGHGSGGHGSGGQGRPQHAHQPAAQPAAAAVAAQRPQNPLGTPANPAAHAHNQAPQGHAAHQNLQNPGAQQAPGQQHGFQQAGYQQGQNPAAQNHMQAQQAAFAAQGRGPMTPSQQPAVQPPPLTPDSDLHDVDVDGGGGVFVPSMSTEGAAAGMLKLPDELRDDPKTPKPGRTKFILTVTLLLVAIVGGLTTAVLIFLGIWKPF